MSRIVTERAIRHEDFSVGVTNQYRYSRIRVVFPAGFDVCDSVIGVQGNMSGVTMRKYGSNTTKNIRFYKADSTVSLTRGITEPSISVQVLSPPSGIPRTGPSPHLCPYFQPLTCMIGSSIATLTLTWCRYSEQSSGSSFRLPQRPGL